MHENIFKNFKHSKLTKSKVRYFKVISQKLTKANIQNKPANKEIVTTRPQHILTINTENLFLVGLKKLEISFLTDMLLGCFLYRFHLSVKLNTVYSTFVMKKKIWLKERLLYNLHSDQFYFSHKFDSKELF